MMIEKNQFSKIIEVIRSYTCDKPLHYFLNSYFRQHRNMGSRDRKTVRSFVYNYFRLGQSLNNLSVEQKIAVSSFLLLYENNSLADYCIKNFTSLNEKLIAVSLDEKIKLIANTYENFSIQNIFSFTDDLSNDITKKDFYKSFLNQPKVWVRVRKKFKEKILAELVANKIEFISVPEMENTFGFANDVPLTTLKNFTNGHFEIQDLSTQKTGGYFNPKDNEHWWDCCAGSGGKSLLLMEQNETIQLTASDNRDSILNNLKERFKKASIKNFEIKKIDLTSPNSEFKTPNYYDGIIVDVPCTGSGTWARSPEMLTCFNKNEIEKYSSVQKNILQNLSPYLKNGNPLIYITCSVFKKENEEVVEYAIKQLGYILEKKEIIKGYNLKADSMFAARLIKN